MSNATEGAPATTGAASATDGKRQQRKIDPLGVGKRARARKRKKKSAASTPAAPRVDPAQALAFVRQRIRESKDPVVKALYEREAVELAERVKKAEEQRIASLSFKTKDGKSAKIGDTVYLFDDGYRNGKQRVTCEKLVVKTIFERKEQYSSHAVRILGATTVGGVRRELRLDSYSHVIYADRELGFRKAIDDAAKLVEEAREELVKAEHDLAALEAQRDGRKLPAAPKRAPRTRKAQTSNAGDEQPELFNEGGDE